MEIAEITINYKPLKTTEIKKINTSKDAESFFKTIWSDKMQYKEEFYMLLLNRNNRIIGYLKISEGGTAGTVVDPKIIFQGALKCNAHGIILCHNHPSGNLKPSEADIKLTRSIKEAGKLLDIQLLDHLIITQESYYSLADEGDL